MYFTIYKPIIFFAIRPVFYSVSLLYNPIYSIKMDDENKPIIDASAGNPSIAAPPQQQSAIDKITLELLMNKNHYNRYMAETNPKKFQEHREHLQNVKKYRDAILEITTELLINPEKQINTEVNDQFDSYVRTLIKYFQMKELDNANSVYQYGDQEDDLDMMFGTTRKPSDITNSFWGKDRVVKKPSSYYMKQNVWKPK